MKLPKFTMWATKEWWGKCQSLFTAYFIFSTKQEPDYPEEVVVTTPGSIEQFLSNWEFIVWDAARSGQYDGIDDFYRSDIYKEYRTNFPPEKEPNDPR